MSECALRRWRHAAVGGAGALVVAALTAVTVATGTPAMGGTRDDVEQRQNDVREELKSSEGDLNEVSGELTAAYTELQNLQARLPALRAALDEARARAQAARDRDAEIGSQLEVAEGALAATGAELASRQAEAADAEREVAGVVRETYRGAQFDELSILVDAQTPDDYADMLMLAKSTRKAQDRSLARLQVQRTEIQSTQRRQSALEEQLVELKAESEAVVAETRAAEDEAARAKADLDAAVSSQESIVAEFEAQKAQEQQRITALNAESDALSARLAAIAEEERRAEAARQAELQRRQADSSRGGSAAPEAAGSARQNAGAFLSYPVDARITSPFGYRVHPILGYRKLHTGTDFGAACGTPVRAAADGTVIQTGWAGGYGNQVVVSHGLVDGVSLATTYNHLSGYAVSGGAVSRGQVIGYVGTTGSSTGCHLHLETREAGTPVDPMNWLS